MNPVEAIAAARILGARTLVPSHFANQAIPLLLETPGTIEDLLRCAAGAPDLDVVQLEPGQRWEFVTQPGLQRHGVAPSALPEAST